MESSTRTSMIKLVASNYSIWKPMMEDLLYCKDLCDPIELKGTKLDRIRAEEWKNLNTKAVSTIRQ